MDIQLVVQQQGLDEEDVPDPLASLAIVAYREYEKEGDRGSIDMAVKFARGSIPANEDGDTSLVGRLNNLGVMLQRLYKRTGEMADLKEAITVARQAVDQTPDNHPARAVWLNNLGNMLERRYERRGEMAYLDEAITIARQAVASTPHDHPGRAAMLNNLGNKLRSRYERRDEIADLEEAITLARQAVDQTPHDHLARAVWLNNLGSMLGRRYERTGEMADLEEAITLARQAVEQTPDDHPDQSTWLNNLGNIFERRYERTGEMADLEEAITLARQAVNQAPDDHPDQAGMLNNLGSKLQRLCKRTGEMTDLEKAIAAARQAVDQTPYDHPDQATWLNNLGNMLESRYKLTGKMADLEEAITVARKAVDQTPYDHPNRATWLNNLGNIFERRYDGRGEMADLGEASSCLMNAWYCRTASPFPRITAAAQCLKLLAYQQRVDVAIQLGKDVIDLLPIVNTRMLERSDQQFVVSTFAGVATDLCAFLLESNQPADALYYLETGRAVIIGQLVDARSDVSTLAQQRPDVARRYQELRDEINAPLRPEQEAAAQMPSRRREALSELDACIQEIRGITGFERFLLGQTAAEMQECASGGTIVVVNVAMLRSDAILVSADAIKTVNLPRLTASDAEVWLGKKWTGPRSERAQKNKEYLEYLSWLWEACVRQVLVEVGGGSDLADGLPRIWWLGTGLASSMPFHAAGTHAAGSTENAFDKVVSSYTPSGQGILQASRIGSGREWRV